MGNACCKCTSGIKKDIADENSSQAQISIQCEDNPEGQDGVMVFDMEAFPMKRILRPAGAEDLPEGQERKQQ